MKYKFVENMFRNYNMPITVPNSCKGLGEARFECSISITYNAQNIIHSGIGNVKFREIQAMGEDP